MAKKSFQYHLSNIDMKPLYREMLKYHSNWPEVIVVDEIEDGSDVMWKKMENGNCLVCLKNSKNMFQILQNELALHKAKVVKAFPFENHRLENNELMSWIYCACEIADILKIRCPQIIFTASEDGGIASGQGMLCLPDTKPHGSLLSVLEMFITIAHELRHEWQYIKHPDWQEDYVQVESDDDENMDAYRNHKAEIDAEAFARKLAEIIFNDKELDLFKPEDSEYVKKMKSRAQRINITISNDVIEAIRELFCIEEEYDDQDEGDETLLTITVMNEIDRYAELQRIKNAKDKDKEINYALKCCESKLILLGFDPEELKPQ